ncbi:MAG TPA: polysaccharide biosynthesis C-terminal domain-containing protein, partial [Solirubrobacteraceae bacterium]|nr:polysaccharide biosynthesis C-terminal domain-containing protein [Solirubrobacteraceae bacterium]
SLALYRPFGIAGIVVGTAVGSIALTVAQTIVLRRNLGGRIEAGVTLGALARIVGAAAVLGLVARVTWAGLDGLLGRDLLGQLASVGTGVTAGLLVYAGSVLLLRVREAQQIRGLVAARMGR